MLGDLRPGLDRDPGPLLALAGTGRTHHEQGEEDHAQQHDVHHRGVVVGQQQLLGDTQGDGGGEGAGQALHARQCGARQCPQQQVGAQGLPGREASSGQVEDGGEGRHRAGDRPGEGGHPVGREPRHGGGVGVGRRSLDGQAVARAPQEDGHRDEQDRGQEQHPRIGADEVDPVDGEGGKAGRFGELRTRQRIGRDEQRQRHQERRVADGGHHAHELGGVLEPAQHHHLRERSEAGGQRHGQGHRPPIGDTELLDAHRQHGGPEGTDLTVGEVHELARPVDEHETGGQQPIGHADGQALHHEGGREHEGDHGGGHCSPLLAPSRNTERSRSPRCSSSLAGPSKRISPFSMK